MKYIKRFDDWFCEKKRIDNNKYEGSEVFIRSGEIRWIRFGVNVGSEIDGKSDTFTRPGIVVHVIGKHLALVIPTNTKIKDTLGYTRFTFKDTVYSACVLQMKVVSQKRIGDRIGKLPSQDVDKIVSFILKFFSLKPKTKSHNKNAIIIHGACDEEEYYSDKYPTSSNSHWIPWLQKQLQIRDVYATAPEMPNPHKPDYEEWKQEFERYDVQQNTILVGHSCGGGFLLRWLSENSDKKVGKVILVAPWLNLENTSFIKINTDFFDFEIDEDLILRTSGITLFSSDNDLSVIKDSVKMILEKVKEVKLVEFHNKGHFCRRDLGTDAFPELLEEIISK